MSVFLLNRDIVDFLVYTQLHFPFQLFWLSQLKTYVKSEKACIKTKYFAMCKNLNNSHMLKLLQNAFQMNRNVVSKNFLPISSSDCSVCKSPFKETSTEPHSPSLPMYALITDSVSAECVSRRVPVSHRGRAAHSQPMPQKSARHKAAVPPSRVPASFAYTKPGRRIDRAL